MLLTCLVASLLGCAVATEQLPLTADGIDLIEKLKQADIVPSLIDAFIPQVEIAAIWENGTTEIGNTIMPQDLQQAPQIILSHWTSELLSKHKYTQITLALTDPDAPSHANNTWSQVCHWLVTKVPLADSKADLDIAKHKKKHKHKHFKELVEYKPPGPPPKTGAHRYVLVAMAPLNGTTKKLRLSVPQERFRWGYDVAGAGVREWAAENGLGVVGANFIYSQNEKQ